MSVWPLGLGGAAAILGVVNLVRHGGRTRVSQRAARLAGGKESLRAMPKRWWQKRAPDKQKLCYRTKTDALNMFRAHNTRVIDDWGGEAAKGSRGEFDALTKYGALATDIAQALWLALPPERTRGGRGPFCLDQIDLDALNDTSPGREHPVGFQLPDFAHEILSRRREEAHYRSQEPGVEPMPRGRRRRRKAASDDDVPF